MKKNKAIILILLITIPIFGFGKESPDKVLIKYLKALYSNNINKTYSYISKADKNTISREDFIKQNSLGYPFIQEIAKTASSLRKYDINETKIDNDNATVDITVTAPDMSKVLGEIFGPFQGQRNMANQQEATRRMLKQYLKKGNVPMVKERGVFKLANEDGKWKVILNLKNDN